MTCPRRSFLLLAALFGVPFSFAALTGDLSARVAGTAAAAVDAETPTWRTDPAWHQGKAEWALYDATRPIYVIDRHYEATLFTNKQYMDPATTTKAADWRATGMVEVFKHNLSEMVPTEHYTYRFLTTVFVRTDDLSTYRLTASTQEDCGASFKHIVVDDGEVDARQFVYFPGDGASDSTYPVADRLAFHDALSLTLRDYPFDAAEKPTLRIPLVPDQTSTRTTGQIPAVAVVTHVGRETIDVPYGAIEAHHLRVEHPADGGATQTDYWFAADPALRHVMVRYEGPYGVTYALKKLGWWAYWDRSQPRPE